jgi:FtsP/CotA-like multicopper oxidase with cupredoxin domain
MQFTRRDLLKLGAFGSAAILLPAERVARTELAIANRVAQSRLPKPFTVPFTVPPTLAPVRSSLTTDFYDIAQQQVLAPIIPGLPKTAVWGYNGFVPGPTIEAVRGRPAVVRQANTLPPLHPTLRYKPWTSTHLHGSASLPQFDGYASDITNPGEFKDYQYPNSQEARTLWYHDHGVHITAPNAYMGLAAMYILHDDLELSLPIPHGRYDVPLILKDALFETNGQLIFDDNDQSGLFGDVILVNGRPWPLMEVEQRKYRFRILNASISRSYGLTLDSGDPLTVIGTDAGLMAAPQQTKVLKMGMAERYEVVIDFAKYPLNRQVVVRNISPDNNIDFATTGVVMAFKVTSPATDQANNTVPDVLNPNDPTMALRAAQAVRTRTFAFKRDGGEWTVNGKTWEDVINSKFTLLSAHPNLGDVEIWRFVNDSGGWFHPVHVHLIDVQILDRNGRPPFTYERGPKDVVYLGEGESVRVITRFGPNEGRYMMHCHNLVHEDHDMMVQFQVGRDLYDPIAAAPAHPLPAPPL